MEQKQTPAKLAQLKAPFPSEQIEWKVQKGGRTQRGQIWALVVPYIQARAVMDRLDDVFGLGGWQIAYRNVNGKGYIASLQVWDEAKKLWVLKEDGAEASEFEPLKGGISGALKRVAVTVGIGRYLYDLPWFYARVQPDGSHTDYIKENGQKVYFKWDPPALPEWARPESERVPEENRQLAEQINGILVDLVRNRQRMTQEEGITWQRDLKEAVHNYEELQRLAERLNKRSAELQPPEDATAAANKVFGAGAPPAAQSAVPQGAEPQQELY